MASETFEELSKIEKTKTVGKGGFRVASCSGISIEDDNGNRVLKSRKREKRLALYGFNIG